VEDVYIFAHTKAGNGICGFQFNTCALLRFDFPGIVLSGSGLQTLFYYVSKYIFYHSFLSSSGIYSTSQQRIPISLFLVYYWRNVFDGYIQFMGTTVNH
jgi:hypothetical protein